MLNNGHRRFPSLKEYVATKLLHFVLFVSFYSHLKNKYVINGLFTVIYFTVTFRICCKNVKFLHNVVVSELQHAAHA